MDWKRRRWSLSLSTLSSKHRMESFVLKNKMSEFQIVRNRVKKYWLEMSCLIELTKKFDNHQSLALRVVFSLSLLSSVWSWGQNCE